MSIVIDVEKKKRIINLLNEWAEEIIEDVCIYDSKGYCLYTEDILEEILNIINEKQGTKDNE